MRANDFVKASGPLMSWDIYLNHYRRIMSLANDKAILEKMATENRWRHKFDFEKHLFHNKNSVVVTSPNLHIVYASSNIAQMTGFQPEELLGQSPGVLQGPETDSYTKALIRQAINKKTPFEKTLVNYRKNGEKYYCQINGYPLFNREKELVNFIAFEREVSHMN